MHNFSYFLFLARKEFIDDSNSVNVLKILIFIIFWFNIEVEGKFQFFSCIKDLLVETETLDFCKIVTGKLRIDLIDCQSNNRLGLIILDLIKHKSSFSWMNINFILQRLKVPL